MKNFVKIVKIVIAAAILGVAVFNATTALNIGKSSDLTLAKIEAVAQGEGGDGSDECWQRVEIYTDVEYPCDNGKWYTQRMHCYDCPSGSGNECTKGSMIVWDNCDGSQSFLFGTFVTWCY